ncbi:MAG: ABC transporter ATP-binding protein [Firmicutes bacterium]|nr:ABC transporter ATP-binding protein [Bacillota bacterium]MDD4263724.1 ABC transporter ATP-binding protein [Bacillota bacterium]MDD4694372.1 ABC transporter ATP-binding protein [Bacillota bacterium]
MSNSLEFLRKIRHYLYPYRGRIFLIILFSALTAGLNLLPLQVMATFVDVLRTSPAKSTSQIWMRYLGENPVYYIVAFAVIYVGSGLIMQLYGFLVSILGLRICEDIRKDAFSWIIGSSNNSIKEGDIVARIINDIDIVSDAIVMPLRGIVVSILELIWALILLYTWSPLLSIVAFCIVPVLYLLGKWSYLRIKVLARAKQNSLGNLTDAVSDALRKKTSVKTHYNQKNSLNLFQAYNQNATKSASDVTKFFTRYWPIIRAISAFGVTLTVGVAFRLLQIGKLAPEDIMVAYLYCQRVYDPILDFTRYNMMISSADAALGRVLELKISIN